MYTSTLLIVLASILLLRGANAWEILLEGLSIESSNGSRLIERLRKPTIAPLQHSMV